METTQENNLDPVKTMQPSNRGCQSDSDDVKAMQPSNQGYQSDSDDDEGFYNARFKHQEGSVSFDSKCLVFEPDDDDVTSTRIWWRDLKKCLLNSDGSEKALVKKIYHDEDKKHATFLLASRERAESLRADIKSRLKANKHQSQSQSQTMDVENQELPIAIAEPRAEQPLSSVKVMQQYPPQAQNPNVVVVSQQQQQQQQQQQLVQHAECCCGQSRVCCCWTWSIIGIIFVILMIISLVAQPSDSDYDYRRFLANPAHLMELMDHSQ